ncbi:MAG: MFS transporter [Thermofilaceae archaeon]
MSSALRDLRSSSRGYKVSVVEGALTVFGSALISPMTTPLLLRLGTDATTLALYTAAVQVSTPPLQLTAAVLLDRFREKRLMIMTLFAAVSRATWLGVLLAIIGVAGGAREVMLLLWLSNALGIFAGLAWTDLMADLVEPERRGRLFALRNTIHGVINIIGLVLAKFIYDTYGYPQGYAAAFGVGTLFLLAAVPLLYMYGDPVRPRGSNLRLTKVFSTLKNSEVIKDSGALATWSFSVNIVAAIWNYHLYTAFKADESWFTAINLAGGIIGTLANPPWGSFYDRFGPRATFLISGLGIVFVPAFFPHLPSLPGQIALQVYSSFLWTGFNLASFNYAIAYGAEYRHVYIAVYNTIPSILAAVGTSLGAWLYGYAGPVAFYASSILRLVSLIVLYRVAAARGATYEELRLASHLYPLYVAGRQAFHATYIEFIYAVRLLYATLTVATLLVLLLALYATVLKLLGL